MWLLYGVIKKSLCTWLQYNCQVYRDFLITQYIYGSFAEPSLLITSFYLSYSGDLYNRALRNVSYTYSLSCWLVWTVVWLSVYRKFFFFFFFFFFFNFVTRWYARFLITQFPTLFGVWWYRNCRQLTCIILETWLPTVVYIWNCFKLTLRRLMSYIYGAPILDVSRSHTTTQHSR